MNRQQRRAQTKREQRTKTPRKDIKTMARKDDLARIDSDIIALREEGTVAITKFNAYANDVTESIRGLLSDAGILDEVDALDKGRAEVRDALQKKINALNTRLTELQKVREYLGALPEAPAASESPAAVVDAPVAEPAVEEPAAAVEEAPPAVAVVAVEEAPVVAAPAPKAKKIVVPTF